MTLNLTGINKSNELNLSGKTTSNNPTIYKINILKKRIIKDYIIPLYSEQWDILNKNKMLIDSIILKLDNFRCKYRLDDLTIYIELLNILKIILEKNNLLTDFENRINYTDEKNNIISMVYKTAKINLLPEYEIYNSILGKPNRILNEIYDVNIINDIKRLMTKESVTYDKIETYIKNSYITSSRVMR